MAGHSPHRSQVGGWLDLVQRKKEPTIVYTCAKQKRKKERKRNKQRDKRKKMKKKQIKCERNKNQCHSPPPF